LRDISESAVIVSDYTAQL